MAETTQKALKKIASKPAKVIAAKKPSAKPTVAKKTAAKPAAPKKAATTKAAATAPKTIRKRIPAAPNKSITISEEQRYRMIAEAAYYRAESRQFKSDPIRDWIEAERDIAILLREEA